MYLKDGGDGAGTMSALKLKKKRVEDGDDNDEDIFQYGIIPLKLTWNVGGKEEILWQNKLPNSAQSLPNGSSRV